MIFLRVSEMIGPAGFNDYGGEGKGLSVSSADL